MKRLLVLPLLAALAGCPGTLAPLVIPDGYVLLKKVNIDPKLLVSCERNLATLQGFALENVLDTHALNAEIHSECYQKVEQLIKVIKVAFPQTQGDTNATTDNSGKGNP